MSLEKQKCIPCEGGVEPLAAAEIENLLGQTPDWEAVDSSIQRTFNFGNFAQAMEFANKIAAIAQEENHHPVPTYFMGQGAS
jgi:4a-hydroxytetrahydrobiopterin dehydratase